MCVVIYSKPLCGFCCAVEKILEHTKRKTMVAVPINFPINSLTIKIDKTAPEAKISVDPNTKDLKVEGTDANLTTVSKDTNIYTVTDEAGNATKLFFEKTFSGKLLTRAKLTGVQYGDDPKISLPTSSFLYVWNPITTPPVLLSQTITVKKDLLIEAVYNRQKDQTIVIVKKKGEHVQKQIFPGLRIPKLTTLEGVIEYEI